MEYHKKIQHSAAYIHEKLGIIQDDTVAFVTGTGLGGLTAAIATPTYLPYREIDQFPVSTVKSHAGRLISGTIDGVPVLALEGRFHLYEGFTAREATHNIRVLGELGIKTLILTNAVGALNPSFETGSPMLIEDHINLTGTTPLRGENNDAWGDRFPDMCAVYDPALRRLAVDKALELGIRLERGVFMQIMGPNMETPAETRMYRAMGADAIGMSTCMEAIAAHHMGIRILGISCLTNKNLPDCMEEASLDHVIAQAEKSSAAMTKLIRAILKEI
ncbi:MULTISPECIES: purine-nucleoside phosphorylase [unclassified Pseudodesulfovibrio]|uniref:purine-nucleoside phosphorylase n=1 Tax=unclassified Pseudodesulfovibrio TaxID=2661612 RepID=UPI000FEBF155|nr:MULTISPECIES: purine-nucleoside phosphorylase [unclassified Pseudodesulfovibrio]MCJ2163254.1 purine-nucleoside phosphorylase [Pseudodesulfovibrio sp. S3-i]RWU07235.1 purine-nucleoside phosphorylase [Pseudodesulfovibrio sp. S3]